MSLLKEITDAIEYTMSQPPKSEEDMKRQLSLILSMMSDLVEYIEAREVQAGPEASLRVLNGRQGFGRNAITLPLLVDRGEVSSG